MGCCLSTPVDFEGEVNLYHFDLHRVVGKGAFGKVRVVEHRRSKKLFALKYIDKAQCSKQRAVANVIQERRLLEEIDHPFIVNMRYAFQDDENCFFVLDLMLGGDLRFHMERKGEINESCVRFWTAELASACNYLHRQKIIHRDIKPDNVLLDAHGHVHLTDFNVAIHYSERRLHTSVAGSMAYMAPEILARKGYTWHVDYWSLGVCVFELLFCRRPFESRSGDKLTQAIMKGSVKFPLGADEKCSKEGQSLVLALLDRNPKTRIACQSRERGMAEFKKHPWFADIEFGRLMEKEIQPPFVPDLNRTNFDVSHELDEFLMVEKTLTHSQRKKNVDVDKMKPEYRMLEEQFTVYDYTSQHRTSYYPHNQPIVVGKADGESYVIPSATNTVVPNQTYLERSQVHGSMAHVSQGQVSILVNQSKENLKLA
ncbi:kinase-like domain-containing protein [Thelephora terrestris]|uniref:Kinase-like domain-containing protein n=1 Tax=Thelephora terrestris TaxID=56493 RepID=A0A9P6L1W8_9AGAM|nr:kinase-like domain-containing protein [Thelephora terrestris]KAF9778973.1 kinase-like domain-containing protein [Thelephora terrestris]